MCRSVVLSNIKLCLGPYILLLCFNAAQKMMHGLAEKAWYAYIAVLRVEWKYAAKKKQSESDASEQ